MQELSTPPPASQQLVKGMEITIFSITSVSYTRGSHPFRSIRLIEYFSDLVGENEVKNNNKNIVLTILNNYHLLHNPSPIFKIIFFLFLNNFS